MILFSGPKTFYNCRKSYVSNNGFLSKPIDLSRGIFQGCPVSPFLFLLAIEILAIAVRSNDNIVGIKVGNTEKKIDFFCLMTQPAFYKESWVLFKHFFYHS